MEWLFNKDKIARKSMKSFKTKAPNYQRRFRSWRYREVPRYSSRMLFRIPAFPAHFVSLSSRTDAEFWVWVYPLCIRRFYRDSLWRTIYAAMHRYAVHQVQKVRAIGRGKHRSLSAISPELPRKFIWIYHRSLVNAQKWEQSKRLSG